MTAQLHEAYVILQARTIEAEDRALLRSVQAARKQARLTRRLARRDR